MAWKKIEGAKSKNVGHYLHPVEMGITSPELP